MTDVTKHIIVTDDGYVRVVYWTPDSYKQKKACYLTPMELNEHVDRLNWKIYCAAVALSKDIKAPHCYGLFQT